MLRGIISVTLESGMHDESEVDCRITACEEC